MGEVGGRPIGGTVTIGTLPGVMTGRCCMTSETICEASMIEDDDMPTILIVTIGAGTAIVGGRCGMAVLAVC